MTDNEKSIYCSGVDPTIVNFIEVNVQNKNQTPSCQWVKNVQRHVHEHDVRYVILHDFTTIFILYQWKLISVLFYKIQIS